jgi:hypothetical protein
MEINNVRVYDLEESIVASGYPMDTEPPVGVEFDNKCRIVKCVLNDNTELLTEQEIEEGKEHIARFIRLANKPSGSGHDCSLKGVEVHYNLTAPEYFWRQFDRYHFHDYTSSESKTHSIHKFEIDKKCNKFVSQNAVNELQYHIDEYNNFKKGLKPYIKLRDGSTIPYTKRNLFHRMISNCLCGFQLTARIKDNYLQLKSKYNQRKNHPSYSWETYCKWMETLPLGKEIITKKIRE